MSTSRVDHDTVLLEHRYTSSPRAVFAAWADPAARVRWSVSTDEVIEFLESDFQVGGRDLSRCGPHGDLRFRVDAQYRNIDPDRRIVFVETVATGDTTISIALVSVEIEPDETGSDVTLTIQIASLVGPDGIAGSTSGYRGALTRLATYLADQARL